MRVVKPMKVPALTRVVEVARKLRFHVATMIAFPLDAPRALLDEMTFWGAVTPELGAIPLDEGISKTRGELLVAGRCFAPEGRKVPASFARVRIASIDKRVAVLGDRYWTRHGFTEPEPFAEMPVDWAHALGGAKDAVNPYGKGREEVERNGQRLLPLPNIERYDALLRSPGDKPPPASFLPMDITFAQRRARAGSYGGEYADLWAPGFPPDVDPLFFNVASNDQWIADYFRGDEAFLVENMHPTRPRIEGTLPGLTPRVHLTRRDSNGDTFAELPLRCDTVWLFPSVNIGVVVFHGSTPVADDDAGEIIDLVVGCEEMGRPRSIDHYREALARRMDKDKGAIATLSDTDLMPPRDSGVAANIGGLDTLQFIKGENLAIINSRRGAERVRQQRREELLAEGIDPAPFGLDEPLAEEALPPPADDLDALVAYLDGAAKQVEEEEAKANRMKEEAEAKAKTQLAEAGISAPEAMEEIPGGPPKFSAKVQYDQYVELAEIGRRGGMPNVELEAMLEDPALFEQLVRLEENALTGYRSSAHLMPAASLMTAEANLMARVVIQAARDSHEDLNERDFTGVDLRGLDLRGMRFVQSFFEGADLRACDLSGAILEGAVLAKADLRGANLTGAKLHGANLGMANLEGAIFDNADLTQATLMGAKVAGARFARANLEGADSLQVAWDGVDLSGANLTGCLFLQTSFTKTNLSGANLERVMMLECTLNEADFSGARVQKASLMNCTGEKARFVKAQVNETVVLYKSALPEADFRDANLERSCFRTTNLQGARFDRAQMTMSDLSEADATGATFDRAVMKQVLLIRTNLERASLRGCNLLEANVSKSRIAGADFSGTQLCRADFSRARGDQKTLFAEAGIEYVRFDKQSAPARDA